MVSPPGVGVVQRMLAIVDVVGVVDQIVVHHPFPAPIYELPTVAGPRSIRCRRCRPRLFPPIAARAASGLVTISSGSIRPRERDRGLHLRASMVVEFDRIAAHHAAFAIPCGFAMAHEAARSLACRWRPSVFPQRETVPAPSKFLGMISACEKNGGTLFIARPPQSNQISDLRDQRECHRADAAAARAAPAVPACAVPLAGAPKPQNAS